MDARDTDRNDRSDRPPEGQRADDGREAEPSVPTDPYLLVGRAVTRLLATLNRAYDSFEDLPGWTRIGFGTALFFVSTYYGQPIRSAVDDATTVLVTPVSGTLGKISLGVRAVLLFLLFVSLQVVSVNRRLDTLIDRVEEGLNKAASEADGSMGLIDDIASDGGTLPADESETGRVDSGWTGVLVGGVAGAALGAQFGLVPIFGGAIMGAIVGDEVEKFAIRRRRRDR